MASMTVTKKVVTPTKTFNTPKTYTASQPFGLDDEAAPGSATTEMNLDIDVSAVKAFFIHSDKNVTIKTNDVDTPGNTLALVANEIYEWDEDDLAAFKLTVDVIKIFVVNAGTEEATINCYGVQDATP